MGLDTSRLPLMISIILLALAPAVGKGPTSQQAFSQPANSQPSVTQEEATTKPFVGAKTPKEAVANLSRAIDGRDKALLLHSIYIEGDANEFLDTSFAMMTALVNFSDSMEKEYGKGASPSVKKGTVVLSEEELNRVRIVEEGEKGSAILPDRTTPLKLIKRDGRWFVDFTSAVPAGPMREEVIRTAKAMVKAVEEVRAKIGQSGMTKETLNQEFIEALVRAAGSNQAPAQ